MKKFANSCANPQNVQNWFHPEINSNSIPELDFSFTGNFGHILKENVSFSDFREAIFQHDPNPIWDSENPIILEENVDELRFVVFGYHHQHWSLAKSKAIVGELIFF